MRPIVIIHENEEWLVPLREAFKQRGVTATEWFLDTGVVPYTQQPDDAVYYNRMSASSHTRAEFVGQQFIYTVQVNTEKGFELCPADSCSNEDQFCPTDQRSEKFNITHRFDDHPIIPALEQFLRDNQIGVAGIEFIENADGELFVYDVNTNTNYNQGAEQRGSVSATGMGSLADYLIGLASD